MIAALVVWCSLRTLIPSPVNPSEVTYNRAERDLCGAQYARARVEFASIVPYASKYDVINGSEWIDVARGYFYALVASGDYEPARRFLTSLETNQRWQLHASDRLFWEGSPRAAFAAYATEARALFVDDSTVGDRNVLNAAQAMSGGNIDAAIADLQNPVSDCGSCTINSLQLLMLGNAYEVQRRWPQAFATWVAAANAGHIVPEYDTLDEWNLSALEMLYYYRIHQPR